MILLPLINLEEEVEVVKMIKDEEAVVTGAVIRITELEMKGLKGFNRGEGREKEVDRDKGRDRDREEHKDRDHIGR